jgi:septal ring factor EnvC (AmiA/AmiB activator)
MTKIWPEIVATDLAARPLGTVLMLGSGGETLLGSLPLAATTRVIRAEPDPRRARMLQRQHVSDSSVTILPVAVAETAGPARLRRFNLSHATSFRAPTGLASLFPGLCETGQAEVETQTVAAVVQEVDLDREADNVLILGLAGEELAVIGQLADLGLLQRFAHVIVPLPSLPLYEGSGDGREIRTRLEEAGFRVESRDMSDPDLAFAHLRIDRVQVALTTERNGLREELNKTQSEIERLKSERDGAASARDAVKQKAASQAEEIARLQEAVSTAESERDRLREAQDTSNAEIERLKSLRAQIAAARDVAQEARTEAEQTAATQAEEIARLQEAVSTAESERDRLREAQDTSNAEIERLKSLRAQIAAARDVAQEARTEAEQKAATQAEEIARLQDAVSTAETERDRLREAQDTSNAEIERLKSLRAQIAAARDAAQEARTEAEQKATSQAEEIARLQDAMSTAEQKREAAQKIVFATQEEKDRIGTLSDTYRHAIRLELMRTSGRASERARPLSPAVLRWLEALDGPTSAVTSQSLGARAFNLEVYRKATEDAADHADRHIVLDVKSIPRSGLHYMKRQFAHLFQDRFSFCEWYQEPGCCKRMPCAFFPHSAGDGAALRMLKSHDFDLSDPVYPVTPGLQRLILVRDPLYVLTSHWVLHLLAKNKEILAANDIRFEKIVYLHEPAVLSRAYALLDEAAVIPDAEAVAMFLSEQQEYLTGFARKWAVAAEMPRTYVVPYDKTPLAIEACLAPIREAMSADQRARLDDYTASWRKSFQPRQDPFRGPTPYLSSLLERHSALFRATADAVRDSDSSGFFDLSG